ncbi:hypothetical protein CDEF62S_00139 [Castellaniella defragrans]
MSDDSVILGPESSFDKSAIHTIELAGDPALLVWRNDAWHLYSARCPHKGATIRQIDLCGDLLACPFHGWMFNVAAEGRETHGYIDLSEYSLEIDNGMLRVDF